METDDVYQSIVRLRALGFKVKRVKKGIHNVNGVDITSKHLTMMSELARDVLNRAYEVRCECKPKT